MKLCAACLTVALFTTSWCSAIPNKNRVLEKHLSEQEHNPDGEHNPDYDHEAFLGHDEAEMYDNLSPEESKQRLAILVDKIDKDGDGYVTEEELKSWVQYVQKKYLTSDTDKMWEQHEDKQDNTLHWSAYQKHTYGTEDAENDEAGEFRDMMDRDKRRWDAADSDKDGRLTKEEFQDFLHPEEADHMKDIVVSETIEDIDKDKDGYISLEEYIGDMWPNQDGEEPDWVKNEREQFSQHRDKNKDGKMDHSEVKDWIVPENYDHSDAEAKHLIYESDANEDGKLTKEEILDKYDVFVGSQATDFGEALARHDEF